MSLIDVNVHDIFMRNAAVALLDLLNSQSTFEIIRNEQVQEVTVPFFYNFGGDEQLMKDFFFNLPPDCNIPLAEGNYERTPRGIITLTSFQVSTRDLVNKFVRGTYNREVRDQNNRRINEAHSARLFSIPLNLMYKVEVRFDTMNEAFKLVDMFLDNFYANRVVYFQYRGVRIPAQFRFPDSTDINKNYTFDYNSAVDNKPSLTLSVMMETYYPSFDKASDRVRKNVVEQFTSANLNAETGLPLTNPGPFIDQTTLPPLYTPPQEETTV